MFRCGRERAAGGHADVAGLADPAVDVVGDLVVVDQEVDGAADADLRIEIDLVRAAAEAGAPEEVLDLLFASSHAKAFLTPARLRASAVSPNRTAGSPIRIAAHAPAPAGRGRAVANRVPMRFGARKPRQRAVYRGFSPPRRAALPRRRLRNCKDTPQSRGWRAPRPAEHFLRSSGTSCTVVQADGYSPASPNNPCPGAKPTTPSVRGRCRPPSPPCPSSPCFFVLVGPEGPRLGGGARRACSMAIGAGAAGVFGMPAAAGRRRRARRLGLRPAPHRLDHRRVDLPLPRRRRDRAVRGDEAIDRARCRPTGASRPC